MSPNLLAVILLSIVVALYIFLIKDIKRRQDKKLRKPKAKADEFGYNEIVGHDEGIMSEVHLN